MAIPSADNEHILPRLLEGTFSPTHRGGCRTCFRSRNSSVVQSPEVTIYLVGDVLY